MSIDKLRELTNGLPPLKALISERQINTVEWETDGGTCIGFSLWDEKNASVIRAFLSKDTHFKRHIHPGCNETMIVYSGQMKVKSNGDERLLKAGDSIILQVNQPHETWAITDVWLIGITVPASEGYPRARKYVD